MKGKVLKARAEAIKKKYDCKRFNVVILFPVSGCIEQRQSDGKVGTADKSRCKLRKGEVKACGDAKHAPEAPLQIHSISIVIILSRHLPFN